MYNIMCVLKYNMLFLGIGELGYSASHITNIMWFTQAVFRKKGKLEKSLSN